jgi:hypothetical protein
MPVNREAPDGAENLPQLNGSLAAFSSSRPAGGRLIYAN